MPTQCGGEGEYGSGTGAKSGTVAPNTGFAPKAEAAGYSSMPQWRQRFEKPLDQTKDT